MPLAVFADILEQLVAGEVAASLDDACEPAIGDVSLALQAAFAAKAEMNMAAFDRDMAVAQGGQPVALVGPGVFAVADAKQCQLHQPHDHRKHLLARQSAALQVRRYASADQWQHAPEGQQLVIFGFVTDLAPARVIAILLAATLVAAGRLK